MYRTTLKKVNYRFPLWWSFSKSGKFLKERLIKKVEAFGGFLEVLCNEYLFNKEKVIFRFEL